MAAPLEHIRIRVPKKSNTAAWDQDRSPVPATPPEITRMDLDQVPQERGRERGAESQQQPSLNEEEEGIFVEGEDDREADEPEREPQWALHQRVQAASTRSWPLPLLTATHEPASLPPQPPTSLDWQSYLIPDHASLFASWLRVSRELRWFEPHFFALPLNAAVVLLVPNYPEIVRRNVNVPPPSDSTSERSDAERAWDRALAEAMRVMQQHGGSGPHPAHRGLMVLPKLSAFYDMCSAVSKLRDERGELWARPVPGRAAIAAALLLNYNTGVENGPPHVRLQDFP